MFIYDKNSLSHNTNLHLVPFTPLLALKSFNLNWIKVVKQPFTSNVLIITVGTNLYQNLCLDVSLQGMLNYLHFFFGGGGGYQGGSFRFKWIVAINGLFNFSSAFFYILIIKFAINELL